jgi:hypothetical protein
MTRCEQRLVLSANCDKQRAKNTFYSWIADEFDEGTKLQLLLTEDDFLQAGSYLPKADIDIHNEPQRLGRAFRIEAALRAAGAMDNLTPKFRIETISRPAAVELNPDVLRAFLPRMWSSGIEGALQHVERIFVMEFAEEFMDEWHRQLRAIGQWIQSVFSACEDVRFFSSIRLVSPQGVRSFVVHVVSRTQIGWIILPGAAGDKVRIEAERFRKLSEAIPDAPQISIWSDEPAIQSGACSA